jgi:hypothetical protein
LFTQRLCLFFSFSFFICVVVVVEQMSMALDGGTQLLLQILDLHPSSQAVVDNSIFALNALSQEDEINSSFIFEYKGVEMILKVFKNFPKLVCLFFSVSLCLCVWCCCMLLFLLVLFRYLFSPSVRSLFSLPFLFSSLALARSVGHCRLHSFQFVCSFRRI